MPSAAEAAALYAGEIPMEVDGGIGNLAQSRHHPNASLAAVNNLTSALETRTLQEAAPATACTTNPITAGTKHPGNLAVKEHLDKLIFLVPADQKNEARSLAKGIFQAIQTTKNAAKDNTNQRAEGFDLAELRKVVAEEATKAATTAVKTALSEAQKTLPTKGTWAAMAAHSATLANSWIQQQSPPKKIIPTRQNRELLVRGADMPPNLARRTPQEIIQVVNQVSSRKDAIAARTLPSSDILVTFKDEAAKAWHAKNKDWILQAFGPQAKEAQRTVAVLIKGLRKADLQEVTEGDFADELGFKTVDKVKFRIPSLPEHTRATVLVALTDQEEARRACDNGVVWRAQLLDCEPYSAAVEPTQCYKCWQWGHTQRYCRKDPLCPRCGTASHGDGGRVGESQCPTHTGLAYRCPTCGGQHPAWARECPKGAEARQRAKEAYQHRPRTFEPSLRQKPVASQPIPSPAVIQPSPAPSSPAEYSDDGEEEGFQEVRRKRGRGRPSALENAGQSLNQSKLRFPQAAKSQPTPSPLSTAQPTQERTVPTISPLPPSSQSQPAEINSQESQWL
jgi:hypothetical protein